jgi:hypothetical protein
MNRHHVIPPMHKGAALFTPEGWQLIESKIEVMPQAGGCVAIVFDCDPKSRNFLDCSIAAFTHKERATLRNAMRRARQKAAEAAGE